MKDALLGTRSLELRMSEQESVDGCALLVRAMAKAAKGPVGVQRAITKDERGRNPEPQNRPKGMGSAARRDADRGRKPGSSVYGAAVLTPAPGKGPRAT